MENGNIFLREVALEDASLLMLWENTPEVMRVSCRESKYSLQEIIAFLEDAKKVEEQSQLRFIICLKENNRPIGTIDLYSINFTSKNAGIGVLIMDEKDRNKGFASEAIEKCIAYGVKKYEILNYFCVVHGSNISSIKLFEKNGFKRVGLRKKWYLVDGYWEDEIMFQRMEEFVKQ
jgi:diamine N-acetyltransferase